MAVVEIPLSPEAQKFAIALAGITYRMRLTYNTAAEGSWILDIGTADGALLIAGLPLVTGIDLLEQHAHLGLGGSLYAVTNDDTDAPTYPGLGVTSHLYFVTA